jgi:hypothetical protein
MAKPRGIRTARHQRVHRREQRWHDKQYKKAHLGTALKANPFGGASHAKGIVLEKVYVCNLVMERHMAAVPYRDEWCNEAAGVMAGDPCLEHQSHVISDRWREQRCGGQAA